VYSIGTTGQDWVNLISQGGGKKYTITVSQSKSSDTMSQSWAKANASYNAVFWSVEASGSWQKLDIDQSDQSVEATIDMTATLILAPPGAWYDGGYMKTLAGNDGSFFPPWTPKGGSSPVFGQNGLLQTMITGLVAVYQPSVTITMSASTYNRAFQQFEASTGVRIGPFTFGGSGGHEANAVKKAASNGAFTAQSTATYPFILGVTVATPGLD
jgi:hypothetical protein